MALWRKWTGSPSIKRLINKRAYGIIRPLPWSGIEVVITALTRNQVYGNVPWVRIPPAPLSGALEFTTFLGSVFAFYPYFTLIFTLIGTKKRSQKRGGAYTGLYMHHPLVIANVLQANALIIS